MLARIKNEQLDIYENVDFWHEEVGQDPVNYYNESRISVAQRRTLKGFDIPNFHARRRRGELLPMTPFRQTAVSGSSSGIFQFTYLPSGKKFWTGNDFNWDTEWQNAETEIPNYVPDSYTNYVTEAAANIYSNGHDTLTFLIELTKVRELFLSVGKSLLKRGFYDWRLSTLPSKWLATRYGWRTLIYDLQSLWKAIQNLNGERTRYSERAGDTISTSNVETNNAYTTHGVRDIIHVDTVEIGIRGSVVADVNVPQLQFNPLQSGWELIPFSFVLDWYFSVGSTLSALSLLSQNMDYVASAGYHIKITRESSSKINEWASGYEGTDEQTATSVTELTVRTPCKIPRIPQYTLRFNNMKIMDLLAILWQQLPRR